MNQRRLRILQGLAAVSILFGIGIYIIDGRSILTSVVRGATAGMVSFIMTAVILFVYWGLKSTVVSQEP